MATPTFAKDIATLEKAFRVLGKTEFRGETTLKLETSAIKEACTFAKEKLGYSMLLDLSGVDHFGDEPRFEVVYELLNLERNDHIRFKIAVSEDNLSVPTVSDVWATADWHERETYDMFGLTFSGHPDLRRILMWDGYPYFPLRKDFPLAGKPSDAPDVAFSAAAPLAGGPFVTVPSTDTTEQREPRSREF